MHLWRGVEEKSPLPELACKECVVQCPIVVNLRTSFCPAKARPCSGSTHSRSDLAGSSDSRAVSRQISWIAASLRSLLARRTWASTISFQLATVLGRLPTKKEPEKIPLPRRQNVPDSFPEEDLLSVVVEPKDLPTAVDEYRGKREAIDRVIRRSLGG